MLLVKNDQHDPEVAQQAVRELVKQGAVGIVGPMTSAMAMAVVPVADQLKVVLVSPTAASEELSGLDDHFLRVTATTRKLAMANARYQLKNHFMRRVAAVYDLRNRAFSENWLNNFALALEEGGGEVVARVEFDSSVETSYFGLAQKLLACNCDGVLIVASAMDSALLCQQVRKLNADIPITLADWGSTEVLIELGGGAIEGVSVVQTFDRKNRSPRYQQFRHVFRDRYGREPGYAGVNSFDAANILLDALAHQDNGRDLKQTILAAQEIQGLQGPILLDEFGDVKEARISISVIRNAQFMVVE
jgi:branched-chain amino acid transport system substrate-binding protein